MVTLDLHTKIRVNSWTPRTKKPEQAYLEIQHGRRFIWLASTGASTTPAREHSPEVEVIQTEMEQLWNSNRRSTERWTNTCRDSTYLNRRRGCRCLQHAHVGWRRRRTQNWKSLGEVQAVLQPEEEHYLWTLCFFLEKSRQWWVHRPLRDCIEELSGHLWIWSTQRVAYPRSDRFWNTRLLSKRTTPERCKANLGKCNRESQVSRAHSNPTEANGSRQNNRWIN